ncbi:HET domain-containing protein [Ilyonectria robusta]
MRLLNSTSFELAEFVGDDIPTYAILSHTWDIEEVTLDDMRRRDFDHLKGFAKIKGCCEQAAQDDLQWVWIDTCCIDRLSSAELSEAINSMYRWYQNAEVCYVYLYDVPPPDPFLDKHLFQNARWFTRGWCLQELIAPREVEFYAENWTELGTKWSLWQAISETTSIPVAILLQDKRPGDFPIAQRMSWASKRNTTREEDMAYCLLGIFDIHMPLLYGEGRRAFIRLQEEIMRRGVDYSIFLWRSNAFHDTTGLLCDSPHYFPTDGVPIRSGGFCKYSDIVASKIPIQNGPEHTKPPEVTPRGLQMTLPTKASAGGSQLAWIYLTHNDGLVCIILSLQQSDYKYHRVRVGCVEIVGEGDLESFQTEYMCMAIFTELSLPKIPMQTLDFKLWMKSTTDEKLSIIDIYPECHLDHREDGSYGMQLNLVACPELFIMVFGVEQNSAIHRFVAALNMFHGHWACKIRKFEPDVPLETVAEEIWKLGPEEEEGDRAISRLPSGTYVTVASKRRSQSCRSHMYVSLIPANYAADLHLLRTFIPKQVKWARGQSKEAQS